ncbi:uncharacterized protein LOC101846429 [Aplysia californica]|uniref:Choline dehydrogenase n=1 Tax=Aplysia californica TaxID=6500 RepID=A0ABM0JRF4_APLCA|nr:uncharacterized protein LOC101846429 [Aplysia californica]
MMSRLISLMRCLRPLRCRTELSTQRLSRLSVYSTAAAPYKVFQRPKSTAAEEDSSRRNFLFETRGCSRHRQSSQQEKAELVIFDKDGTLICFHSMWSSWAVRVTESIARHVGLDIEDKLYETLGVCALSKRVFPGLLAEMTSPIIQEELVKVLVAEGVPAEKARKAVVDSWVEGDSGKEKSAVQSIHPDLISLFKILKANDVKIAICTADNRRGTMNTLRHLGLTPYIDMVVCGNDPNTQAKPNPHNAWKICGELGVDPEKTVMVGDTKADMGMGHSAKLGWVIGVLSGVGDTEELLPEANYVIDNVKDLLPLIMPYDDWVNYYTYSSHERVLREPVDLDPVPKEETQDFSMDNYDVVIFDLNGTLVCTHHKYIQWLEKLTSRLEVKTGMDLGPLIYKHLGVSRDSKKVQNGLLGTGAHIQLKEALVQLLRQEGFHYEEAIITINQAWQDCEDAIKSATIVPLDKDTQRLFHTLKENGVKIAINTTESRETALNDLKAMGLTPYVDMMVCGDDPMSRQKSDPHNALLICEEMGTSTERAVVVGDTMEDISMGLKAKVGLTIGVLTGVGSRSELVQADHIVPSVSEILLHMKGGEDGDGGVDNRTGSSATSSVPPSGRRLFSTSSASGPSATSRRSFSTTSRVPAQETMKSRYDYVIVGAGSAGCVLANRLTEDGQNKVLLIEAGPKDKTWKIHMPAALMYNLCDDQYNWYYHTEPEKWMNNRVMYQPRGRVWGGSSSLNAMVYIRGHAGDYDGWEKLGAAGWSYADCLPYFKKSQTHELGEDEYRGGDGPLKVSRGKTDHPLHHAFIEAGQQAGYPFTDDMNGYQQEGVGWMDMTIFAGMRWSAASGYLLPALHRPNLDTVTKTMTNRILFSGLKATAVEVERGGQVETVEAEKEVILCGGAYNSPQLLSLSGVGDGDLLKSLDIPVVHHLPGVGQNLQDHLEIYIQQTCKEPITLYSAQWKFPHNMVRIGLEWFVRQTGWGATAHLESGGFIRSRAGLDQPNLQYHFLPSTVNDHGRKMGSCHAYQVHIGPMRPTSRGSVTIKSKDPREHPKIVFNYLSTQEDIEEFRAGITLTREIFAQKAFDKYRGPELAPGADIQTDEQIDAFARRMADSAYHPSCTNKMGSPDDPMAVVDPSARVIGLEGLRVVDASIMPQVVSGNLNGPTIMVAEKAADIIRGRKPLPKSTAPVYRPADPNKQR